MNYNVESLKGLSWVKDENEGNFKSEVSYEYFLDMTGIHVPTLQRMNDNSYVKDYLMYVKSDEGKYLLFARVMKETESEYTELFCEHVCFDTDELGLFPVEEEKKETESVDDFFNGTAEEVLEKIKERYLNLYNELETEVINNLDDSQKEDIADEWISDNVEDAWDKTVDNMSDYRIRDFVKDYIQDNL